MIHQSQEKIAALCKEDGIAYLALFGSYARGEENSQSDVDVLVKYNRPVGFFDLYETEEKLRSIFKRNIDLITLEGIKKHLLPYIQSDLTVLYENS